MFDIDSLPDLPTAEIEILNPHTGKPTGAAVTLLGPEHPRRRELEFRQARRLRQRLAEGQPEEDPAGESAREEWVDWLVACTAGWSGFARDGKELPYSEAAARDLYDSLGWLREQVGAAIGRRELFIGGSATGSSPGPGINKG